MKFSTSVVLVLVSAWVGLIAEVQAQSTLNTDSGQRSATSQNSGQPAATPSSKNDEDYNFNWLDPDKKIYVLQNRKYEKAGGAHFAIMGGMGFGDTYRQAYYVQPRFGVWFNEDIGIEGFYGVGFTGTNGAYDAQSQAVGTGTTPVIREIKGMGGLLLNWAPWYAKINVFNSILYFDWIFSAGAGMLQTEIGRKTKAELPNDWTSENLFATFIGTGQLFHLSQSVNIRIDFLGYIYKAKTFGGLAGAPVGESWFSNFVGSLGIGFKL